MTETGLSRSVIVRLIHTNLAVLCKLYDHELGTFNYGIYARNSITRLVGALRHFGVLPLNLVPVIPVAPEDSRVWIDTTKDLKYVGHACLGILWYALRLGRVSSSECGELLDMAQRSLEYLLLHQSKHGYVRCRYVRSGREEARDSVSIAETTNSFVWCCATALSLSHLKERDRIDQALGMALVWLSGNRGLLVPQEKSRLIYALAQLYVTRNDEHYLDLISLVSKDLISELNVCRSFGLFSNDIDAIGALSLSYSLTNNGPCRDLAVRLVNNQLNNQGSEGQWRCSFWKRSGRWRRLQDVTYTVHQLGMAPFALTLYLALPSSRDSSQRVHRAVKNGILWVESRNALCAQFIVRSFAGLTGGVYEFEQRSYEPGLNILGLSSYMISDRIQAEQVGRSTIPFTFKENCAG
jgi:hypothetical protein